jgi:hypothetical protein
MRKSPQRSLAYVTYLLLLASVGLALGSPGTVAAGVYQLFLPLVNTQVGNVFYLSPNGNDSRSGSSAGQAWATFSRAWQTLRAGDTLVLLDGTYNQSIKPNQRNGEPGKPITIRAQNDGQAIIDGQFVREPMQLGDSHPTAIGNYYVIEGLVLKNSYRYVVNILGHHNVLRRVSAYDADTDTNTFVFNLGVTAQYNLIEDCVAAGTGRKMMLIYGGQYNTFRRCFTAWLEWDGRDWHDAWPWGENINIYNANHNIVENSIGYGSLPYRSISIISNCEHCAAIGNKVLGSIAINAGMNPDGTAKVWGATRPQPSQYTSIRDFDWPGQRAGFQIYAPGEIRDNLFQDIFAFGNAGLGLNFLQGNHPNVSNNRVVRATIINNGLDNRDGYGGLGTDAMQEELSRFSSIQDSRIDEIFVAWQSGTRRTTSMTGEGARLTHRYVDGVLTSEPLWPWPMEGRIQAELGISVTTEITALIFGSAASASGTAPQPDLQLFPELFWR